MNSITVSAAPASAPSIGTLGPAAPLRERVYDRLEKTIVDGIFKPGYHLREDVLAKQLGVSRNPVREALQRLVHDGLVDHRPGKGVFVHDPSLKEIEDVFQARRVVESESARLAASRISDLDLAYLEELISLGRSATDAQDAESLLELNERFHGTIVKAADNSVLARMMVTLERRIRWYFTNVVVERAPGSWEQHAQIYLALCGHDGVAAARAMTTHVNTTGRVILANQRAIRSEGAE